MDSLRFEGRSLAKRDRLGSDESLDMVRKENPEKTEPGKYHREVTSQ